VFCFRQDALRNVIVAESVDALLIAGNVFYDINLSGDSRRLLYVAIAGFLRANPQLQIVITAGNHDPGHP